MAPAMPTPCTIMKRNFPVRRAAFAVARLAARTGRSGKQQQGATT